MKMNNYLRKQFPKKIKHLFVIQRTCLSMLRTYIRLNAFVWVFMETYIFMVGFTTSETAQMSIKWEWMNTVGCFSAMK